MQNLLLMRGNAIVVKYGEIEKRLKDVALKIKRCYLEGNNINEVTLVENEYKSISIFKNKVFWQGCRTNRMILSESLYKIQIKCFLEGHKILDTNILDKTEDISYLIEDAK